MGADGQPSAEVWVTPANISIGVLPDEAVMHAARRQGYHWPSICGGQGLCGACLVGVLDGAEHVVPPQNHERARLDLLGRRGDGAARLACQLTVTGAVSVFKRGVKPVAGAAADSTPPPLPTGARDEPTDSRS